VCVLPGGRAGAGREAVMARSRGRGVSSVILLAMSMLAGAADAKVTSATDELLPLRGPSLSSVQSFDELFTFPLEDGCSYSASIRGTIKPVVAGMGAGEKVEPDLAVTAILACQGMATIKVNERIVGTGPLTRAQLENVLERRASILREDAGRRCSYVPEIQLTGEGLVATRVTFLCPLPPP
jgi:hypothetical protein